MIAAVAAVLKSSEQDSTTGTQTILTLQFTKNWERVYTNFEESELLWHKNSEARKTELHKEAKPLLSWTLPWNYF